MSRPRTTTLVAALVFVVVIAGTCIGPAAAKSLERPGPVSDNDIAPAHTAVGPPIGATNTTDIDPDAVMMGIQLAPNGSAHWRVSYRLRLEDDNATAAFESLRADIAANESAYTARFADRMNRTVALAAETTGRSMAVGPVGISTRREALPQEYGIVTYDFRWIGFAETAGNRLLIGDAISGLFLDRRTTLRAGWSGEYTPSAIEPAPDERQDGAVIWRGPTAFADDQPRMTLEPTPQRTSGSPTATPASDPEPGTRGQPSWLIGGLLVGLLLALGALWLHRRRSPHGGGADESTVGTADPAPSSGGEEPPAELLSNEERVLRVLEDNGGRMKQQAIAEALEWTDAKTSQVIGDLRAADDVETFRLGRENVVTLPDAGGPIE